MSENNNCPPGYERVSLLVNSKDLAEIMAEWASRRKVDPSLYDFSAVGACQHLLSGALINWARVWRESRLATEAHAVMVRASLAKLREDTAAEIAAETAKKAETSARREPVRSALRKKAHRDGQFTRLSDAERLKVATIGAASIAASIHCTAQTVVRAVGGHKIRAITAQAIRNELARGAK